MPGGVVYGGGVALLQSNITIDKLITHHIVSYLHVCAYPNQHINMGLPSSKLFMAITYPPCVV